MAYQFQVRIKFPFGSLQSHITDGENDLLYNRVFECMLCMFEELQLLLFVIFPTVGGGGGVIWEDSYSGHTSFCTL